MFVLYGKGLEVRWFDEGSISGNYGGSFWGSKESNMKQAAKSKMR